MSAVMKALLLVLVTFVALVLGEDTDPCRGGRCNGNIGLGVGLGASAVTIALLLMICVATMVWKEMEKRRNHYGPIAEKVDKE